MDRGKLKVSPKGLSFLMNGQQCFWSKRNANFKKKTNCSPEVEWASRGVKARVKRNVRRLSQVREMRDKLKADESAYRRATKKISYEPIKDLDNHTKVICEFYNVHKSFQNDDEKLISSMVLISVLREGIALGSLVKMDQGNQPF